MGKKIESLERLSSADSFIQINYIDGVKIIDHIGKLLSDYREKYPKCVFQEPDAGVVITSIDTNIESMKIDNNYLWCHVVKLAKQEQAINLIKPHIEYLKKEIDIHRVSRIGYRTNYIYETSHMGQINEIKKRFELVPKVQFGGASFAGKFGETDLVLNIVLLVKKDDYNSFAIKFDVDSSIRKEIKNQDIEKEFLNLISVRNDNLLEMVNSIL
jgi:hypothetical protein